MLPGLLAGPWSDLGQELMRGEGRGKGRSCPSICAFIRSHRRACRCLFHPDAGLRMQGALRDPERRGTGDITESQCQWSTGAGGPRSKKDGAWGRKLSKSGWLSVRCEGTTFQQQRQRLLSSLRSFSTGVGLKACLCAHHCTQTAFWVRLEQSHSWNSHS